MESEYIMKYNLGITEKEKEFDSFKSIIIKYILCVLWGYFLHSLIIEAENK